MDDQHARMEQQDTDTQEHGMDHVQKSRELLQFVASSPSVFHGVQCIRRKLDAAGFAYLPELDPWCVEPGGRYYTVRNGSSLVAFKVGTQLEGYHFQMAAAHLDSPTFKVKADPELVGPDSYLRLNVEGYGGMIDYTWLDRPLSLAGRVMVRDGHVVESRLFAPDRDLLLIPSVAIHMNREINQGFAPNRQVDLCPLMSAGALEAGAFKEVLAQELGVRADQVLGYDLNLVNRQAGSVWGPAQEFVSSPKLDDLQGAFATVRGFLEAQNDRCVQVLACFDSEEVGSGTRQGAKSTFLRDTLMRLNAALGKGDDDYLRAIAASMLVSVDSAHALHPNHPEHADATNRPQLNGGIVIKEHAAQLYATDAFGRAAFVAVCDDAGVPTQLFANRSDKRGGSTLGNLSNMQVSVHAVDVGLPILAMHSAYETAGTRDTALGEAALRAFFEANLVIEGADCVRIG